MKRSAYNIPEELVEEILVRLPVKSLLRFKSVCKYWNSLITNPKFIDNHLQLNQDKTSEISLVFCWSDKPEGFRYCYHPELDKQQRLSLVTVKSGYSDNWNNNVVPCAFEPISLPLRPKLIEEGQGLLTSLRGLHCNGILCLVDCSPFFCERIVFYNQALRERKFIQTQASYAHFFCACGFGYDPKTNDYKFVRIVDPDSDEPQVTKAEVYTLGTDSWREVIKLDRRILVLGDGAYLKGFYYWVSSSEDTILSFDMSEDKFSSFMIPNQARHGKLSSLCVWNDSLGLFFNRSGYFNSKSFEMWVMAFDNNSDVVWTKHGIIEHWGCDFRPLMFWKNDELVMELGDGSIMSYNLYTKKANKLTFHEAMYPYVTSASLYTQSLVSVKTRSTT